MTEFTKEDVDRILSFTGRSEVCSGHDTATREALLAEVLQEVLEWLEQAPFEYANGNTHNGVDEGEYYGWRGHNELVEKIKVVLN